MDHTGIRYPTFPLPQSGPADLKATTPSTPHAASHDMLVSGGVPEALTLLLRTPMAPLGPDHKGANLLVGSELVSISQMQHRLMDVLQQCRGTPLSGDALALTLFGSADRATREAVIKSMELIRFEHGEDSIVELNGQFSIGSFKPVQPAPLGTMDGKVSSGVRLQPPDGIQTSDGRLVYRNEADDGIGDFYLDGQLERLTPVQRQVLALLMQNPGEPMSTDEMAQQLRPASSSNHDLGVMSRAVNGLHSHFGTDIVQKWNGKYLIGTVGETAAWPDSKSTQQATDMEVDDQPLEELMQDDSDARERVTEMDGGEHDLPPSLPSQIDFSGKPSRLD